MQTAVDAFGTLDILVNNAGIVRDRTLLKMDEDDFDAVVAVHLKGTFNCGRHAAEVMKEKGYGRIINITSSAGLRGNFGQTNYGAAKAGIMGMTFVWSMELGRYGITVNAVAPSGATRMTAALFEKSGQEPPPEENPALNAPLVAFLASEQAGHVNGQILGRTEYAYTRVPAPEADRVDGQGRRLDAGRGRRRLRQGPRPAPAAGRHGDAEVDDEVTVMRWPARGRRRHVRAARRRRSRGRDAAAADGYDHIDAMLGADADDARAADRLPDRVPQAGRHVVHDTRADRHGDDMWDRAVRWWQRGAARACSNRGPARS